MLKQFLGQAPHFRKLSISNIFTRNSQEIDAAIAKLLESTRIEWLAISGEKTGGINKGLLAILKAAKGHRTLRALDIRHNGIDDAVLMPLTTFVREKVTDSGADLGWGNGRQSFRARHHFPRCLRGQSLSDRNAISTVRDCSIRNIHPVIKRHAHLNVIVLQFCDSFLSICKWAWPFVRSLASHSHSLVFDPLV
jgi:hypothetical protein